MLHQFYVGHLRRKSKALHCDNFRKKKKVPICEILTHNSHKSSHHRTLSSNCISISANNGIHLVSRISAPHICACKLLLPCQEQKKPLNRQSTVTIHFFHRALPILVTLVIILYFYNVWCIFCFIYCPLIMTYLMPDVIVCSQ